MRTARVISRLLFMALCAITALGAAEVQTASGEDHTLLLDASGQVWAWGQNNAGQLGDGSMSGSPTIPVQVTLVVTSSTGFTDKLAV